LLISALSADIKIATSYAAAAVAGKIAKPVSRALPFGADVTYRKCANKTEFTSGPKAA